MFARIGIARGEFALKICRYNGTRFGLVRDGFIHDVTAVLEEIPPARYPFPHGDQFIARLDSLMPAMTAAADAADPIPMSNVTFESPVANPGKIIGAPINYTKHIDESQTDDGIVSSRPISHIADWGLFLKANSALVGPSDGIALRFLEARNDHEVELAVVIGKQADNVDAAEALEYVAGYTIGLDITTRGKELQSFRKSADTYAVLGPWLVTSDEIDDPNALDLKIEVKGEVRQSSNTRHLVYDVHKLVEYASARYTLHPGDIIMTGTPEGVGPIEPGDTLHCEIENIGTMDVTVREFPLHKN